LCVEKDRFQVRLSSVLETIPLLQIAVRLLLSVLLTGLLGWERESHEKPAGLRTHMLVGLGTAAFTLVAIELFHLAVTSGSRSGDPSRVIEGIAGGIGFLGAGSILREQKSIAGIT